MFRQEKQICAQKTAQFFVQKLQEKQLNSQISTKIAVFLLLYQGLHAENCQIVNILDINGRYKIVHPSKL